MTHYRLFAGTSGPSAPVNYSGNMIYGIVFAVAGGGNWFEGYWYYCSPTQSTTSPKCALWAYGSSPQGSSSLVPGSVVAAGATTLTAGQWNYIPLSTPIPLSATYDPNKVGMSGAYVAAFGVNGTFNDSQDGYWNSNNPSSGPIHTFKTGSANGPWNSTNGSGLFTTAGSDPSLIMPGGQDSGNQFYVDVQISDTAPASYTGTYRLWPNPNPSNAVTTLDDATAYTVGTEIQISQMVNAVNVWYFSDPSAASLGTKVSVWNVSTQSVVLTNASPTWSGAAGSGWVSTPLTGTLAPGTYRVSVYNSAGGSGAWNPKDASTAYFDLGVGSSGITNGPISAPKLASAQAGVLYNGTQAGGAATPHAQPPFGMPPGESYPNQWAPVTADTDPSNAVHTQNYWVDLEVQPVAPVGSLSLFSQSTAGIPGATSDNGPYTMGVQYSVSAPAVLDGIWFYSPPGAGELPESIGSALVSSQSVAYSQSASWSGAAGSGWVYAPFTSPLPLTAGTQYKGIITKTGAGNGWYASTPHYWDTGGGGASGITNGILTAPNSTSADGGNQDSFNAGASITYPAGGYEGSNYWIDVAISPAPGGTAHTVGASLTVTPTFVAGRVRGRHRSAGLTVTPVFSAHATITSGSVHHTVGASLTVTPTFVAGRVRGRKRAAALTVTPVFHAYPVLAGPGINVKTVSVTSECDVHVGLSMTATMECKVGPPYQGGMRAQPLDRWQQMYPS